MCFSALASFAGGDNIRYQAAANEVSKPAQRLFSLIPFSSASSSWPREFYGSLWVQ